MVAVGSDLNVRGGGGGGGVVVVVVRGVGSGGAGGGGGEIPMEGKMMFRKKGERKRENV